MTVTARPYEIIIGPLALLELESLRVHDHRRVVEAIEERLEHEPLVENRNRKPLAPVPPELEPELAAYFPEGEPHAWELRVGPWRVIYAVIQQTVYVLRVVKKGRRTTRQALS